MLRCLHHAVHDAAVVRPGVAEVASLDDVDYEVESEEGEGVT